MPLTTTVLSIGFTGLITFLTGLAFHWTSYSKATGLSKLITLACPLEAAALAAFAAEHLAGASIVAGAVPRWAPWPLFWTYLVGLALLATALCLALRPRLNPHLVRLAAGLCGAMLLAFVLLIHIPNTIRHYHDRIFWNVALRDLSFSAGLVALALTATPKPIATRLPTPFPGLIAAAIAIPFGIEHLLYPANLPGVPLEKLSPPWLLLPHLWAIITGLTLILFAAAILLNRFPRSSAALIGLWQLAVVLAVYLPMLALAGPGAPKLEALNYIFDTTLYAATFLLIAASINLAPARAFTLIKPHAA